MMRSSPMVWLFACMYAFTAQMCCCQRADVAMLLAGGAGDATSEMAPIESKRIACCSKCADKDDGQRSTDSDRANSKSKPASSNCDDCDQCVAGAHADGGTASKHIDAPAPASLNVLASLCACVEIDHEARHARWITHETDWNAGQETLVRLHCALMV